ncbi:Gfo/Idh/MocA family protein [Promethearchaeum syntrophicum]|uniref:Gfo/Idh/MocA family protein n=1 Tax=Promethearchaeum syntrophicum TaxID=2594042 RepID=A0A5B9DA06_9ARCH|nr:Gfo/Idh/MocA family oxidoreductase [Candidatus Prometheoarchaeum syntrophicum]QEE16059.1 putative oxidoreductase [Candidatus Prometheoarchaeum syntrophicum]
MVNKVKFAMCGCGHIAPRWFDVFKTNNEIKLVAIADPDPNAFGKLKKYNFPDLKTFSTIEQAYEESKPDAVIISTPPQYHSRYIIDAINRGIHVITEKPLCTNLGQFKHLRAAYIIAKENKVITAVNQQYRWNPRIQAIREAVQKNLLGDIFLVNSTFSQNNYHFKKWWRQQEEYISIFNWYVHMIDSMRYYLNLNPIKVHAKFIHPPHSKILGYSSLLLDVTFEKGIIWHLTANQESVAGPTTSGHTRFTMYGSKGTLVNTKNEAPYLYTSDGKKSELGENIADIDNASTYPPGWKDTIEKFIHSIRTGEEHPTSMGDNFWTISILLAAIKSFELQRTVNIAEIIN